MQRNGWEYVRKPRQGTVEISSSTACSTLQVIAYRTHLSVIFLSRLSPAVTSYLLLPRLSSYLSASNSYFSLSSAMTCIYSLRTLSLSTMTCYSTWFPPRLLQFLSNPLLCLTAFHSRNWDPKSVRLVISPTPAVYIQVYENGLCRILQASHPADWPWELSSGGLQPLHMCSRV